MSPEISAGGKRSLRRIFDDLVWKHFFDDVRLEEPAITQYVSNILIDFVDVDNLYRIRNAVGERLEDVGEMLIESNPLFFIDKVTRPAIALPRGLPRLWGLINQWLVLVEKRVFSGGCFFSAASFEFDGKRGPVHDRIAAIMREWMDVLTRAIEEAQKAGHIGAKVNRTRLAFEIQGIAIGAHWAYQLLDDQQAYSRARETVLEKLRGVATAKSPRLP